MNTDKKSSLASLQACDLHRNQNTLTRRTFLKGAAYASALSAGSFSGLSLAKSITPKQDGVSKSGMVGEGGLMAVTLSNQSDEMVTLDAGQPVSLEKVNDWVVIKVNKAKSDTDVSMGKQISLAAGQECSFPVDAEVAPALNAGGAYIVITNEFSPLDNLVPVTHANAAFA